MFRHKFSLSGDVSRREVGNFEGLSLDPSEGFKVFQEEVFVGEAGWKLDAVVATTLRNPHDSLNLLDLLVIRRGNTIQEGGNLGAQICGCNEGAEYIFGKDIGEGAGVVFDIIVRDVDVL